MNKISRVKLNQESERPYSENRKSSMKEIEEYTNKWRDILCSQIRKINVKKSTLWRRQWHPTPVLLPGKSHGWRSLVGCSPWGC